MAGAPLHTVQARGWNPAKTPCAPEQPQPFPTCLAGGHEEGPPDEEAHDGEGEERGLPPHRVHQEHRRQRAEEGAQRQQAACKEREYTGH